MGRHASMAVVDTVMFLVFLALSSPGAVTGFMMHEWFGLAFLVLLVAHVTLSWGWVVPAIRRALARRDGRARINVLLNATLLAMMSVATISGLVISACAPGRRASNERRSALAQRPQHDGVVHARRRRPARCSELGMDPRRIPALCEACGGRAAGAGTMPRRHPRARRGSEGCPNWILVAALIILPLFPFVVFVTNVGRPRPVAVQVGRSAVKARLSDPAAARRFIKERRADRHLTPGIAIVGLSVPIAWVALFAVVGRRGFALRV